MTDSDRLLMIANFMFNEGTKAEDSYKLVLSHRTVQWRTCDTLDFLELIQLRDRWEYFQELDVVIGNLIYGEHRRRKPWQPLR